MSLVRCEGAGRTYGRGVAATVALQPTNCVVEAGARIALTGPSGSGKSTLLHLLAGLEPPTVGRVMWPDLPTPLRPGPVAVVFQGPSLLPPLTVVENVALPLVLAGWSDAEARHRARRSLGLLDLGPLADKLPEELSGGQAQRAAVVRALVAKPQLILADEPTGQLDHVTGGTVASLLLAVAEHLGAALIVATHDAAIAEYLPERWEMLSGRITGAAWSR
jgi:putative ABC transport system ATP-binding protein/lipoprotein-releasing system ATP-binding protein